MSRAAFIAGQKASHGVPYVVACRALGVSQSWFFKWHDRPPAPAEQRRVEVDAAVAAVFEASGHVRVAAHSRWAGRGRVAHQRENGREIDGPPGPGGPGKEAPEGADQAGQEEAAVRRLAEPRLHRARAEPEMVRRYHGNTGGRGEALSRYRPGPVLPAAARVCHQRPPDAVLAGQAIKMAVAARGGNVAGVIFHTDRGSTYTADDFTGLCAKLKITQSMGRVGSCFDNAAAESFFSTLEWEVLSRHHFSTPAKAREVVTRWSCDFCNKARLHSSCNMKSPIDYENSATMEAA